MVTKKENQREVLLAELDLHKTEYNALRQEILQLKDAEKQYLNLCFVAIGAGLGLSSFIVKEDLLIILLLFPFVFHILLWEMLNSWRGRNWLYRYMLEVLIPRTNYIINELGNNEEQIQVLRWTGYISAKKFLTLDERILLFFSPSSHVIPVLSVGVLVIAFLLISNSSSHILSQTEVWLIYVNLGMLIFAAIQIIFNNRSDARKAKIANVK